MEISAAPWLNGSATTPDKAKRLAASGIVGAASDAETAPSSRATASASAETDARGIVAAAATGWAGLASRSPQNTAAPAASAQSPVVATGACQRAAE